MAEKRSTMITEVCDSLNMTPREEVSFRDYLIGAMCIYLTVEKLEECLETAKKLIIDFR